MIHRFRVRNFKSIVDVDVELSPVTVLVGKSGTGKSNFVQALRFLRDVLISNQSLQQAWPRIRPAIPSGGPTTFEIEFSVAGIDERYQYELYINQNGPSHYPENEILKLGDKILFHQDSVHTQQQRWRVAPKTIPAPTCGPIALGRIPGISESVIAYTALTSGIGCYIFSDSVLSRPETSNSATFGLADDGSNYLSVIKEIVTNLQELYKRKKMIAVLQHVNPSIALVELNDIQNPNSVVVGHKYQDKSFTLDLSQESDGFRRIYARLLALYQRPPKQTLIFEHPEDGIHPQALELLAGEFKASPEQGRGQVILTTHNPELLNHFEADQIRVVENIGGETKIGFMADEQKESVQEHLLAPGELLTVDPARIRQQAVGV
jgi:predicted ATPase